MHQARMYSVQQKICQIMKKRGLVETSIHIDSFANLLLLQISAFKKQEVRALLFKSRYLCPGPKLGAQVLLFLEIKHQIRISGNAISRWIKPVPEAGNGANVQRHCVQSSYHHLTKNQILIEGSNKLVTAFYSCRYKISDSMLRTNATKIRLNILTI